MSHLVTFGTANEEDSPPNPRSPNCDEVHREREPWISEDCRGIDGAPADSSPLDCSHVSRLQARLLQMLGVSDVGFGLRVRLGNEPQFRRWTTAHIGKLFSLHGQCIYLDCAMFAVRSTRANGDVAAHLRCCS